MKNKKEMLIFLNEFEGDFISLDELVSRLSLNKEQLEKYLSNYSTYSKDKVMSYFRIVSKYWNKKGEEVKDRDLWKYSFSEKKEFKEEIVGFKNRYNYSKSRKADLLFNKIKGQTSYRGEIDESDIGGLYHSEWMVTNFEKVEYIRDIQDLMKFFPEDYNITYDSKKEMFSVFCKRYKEKKYKNHDICVALVDCLMNIAKNNDYYVVMLKSSKYKKTFSNAFYKKEEAELYLKKEFRNSKSEKFYIEKIEKEAWI